jgi:hypothetical protein
MQLALYPTAVRERFLIGDRTLQRAGDGTPWGFWHDAARFAPGPYSYGLSGLEDAGLGDATADVSTTIDTLAQDAAAVIQASSNPNVPPTYKGTPIFGTATQTGITVGTALAVGVGVFLLARMLRR